MHHSASDYTSYTPLENQGTQTNTVTKGLLQGQMHKKPSTAGQPASEAIQKPRILLTGCTTLQSQMSERNVTSMGPN